MLRFVLTVSIFIACTAYAWGGNEESLPEQVPYLGPEEDYFLGNGISGAMGTTNGNWSALLGPNYTSPNFLSDETLYIVIDKTPVRLAPKMHRAQGTGIFYGKIEVQGLTVCIADFTNTKHNWVTRCIRVLNLSGKPHAVAFRATITPASSVGDVVAGEALRLHADTTQWNFDTMNKESKNWADRYALITFTSPCSVQAGTICHIETQETTIAPGKECQIGLYHDMYYSDKGTSDPKRLATLKARKPDRDLQRSMVEWTQWLASGKTYTQKVTDPKARDVIEGSLIIVKMLQDSSGGFIAGLREYPHSYVRDSHGGARLLGITQHNSEIKQLILNIMHKTNTFGHIPNAWQMGSDQWHLYRFNNPNAESPAYCVLLLKYYLTNTHDYAFARKVFPFIQHAVDVQVNDMKRNGWKIDFNGDETERYTVRTDGQTYGILSDWASDETCKYWSLSSTVAALASIEYFVDLCQHIGKQTIGQRYAEYPRLIRQAIDNTFWRNDLGYHDWCRKPDGQWPTHRIPNYMMMPLWLGVELDGHREISDALAARSFVNPQNGYLPTAPGDVEGFSGHNLGYLLYDLTKLNDPMAQTVFNTLMTRPIISCWGTVSEFYGPECVPNGHLMNTFSSGILGEALLQYFLKLNP